MKILLINKFHYLKGGAEKCYFDTAKILAEHGHDLAFFSMQHQNNVQSRWSKYFVDNVDYNNNSSKLFYKFKSAFNIIYNFQAQKKLEKLIQEFKPDVAHLHNIYHQLSPSIINTLKKYNTPVLMTLHDYKLICPNYSLLVRGKVWEKSRQHKYYKCIFDKCVKDSYLKSLVCTIEAYLHKWMKVYNKVDYYISPSNFLIDKFKEFGFNNKIIYLPNPLPSKKVMEHKYKIEEKEKYILYFGRLSQEKGVLDLIEAYKKLNTDIKLYIVGDGPQKEELITAAKKSGLDKKIIFLGYKTGEELFKIINNAVVVVIPSKWYENAPYSVLESLELGKVIVSSNIGGLKELIIDGENGYVFDFNNTESLASKIKQALISDNKFIKENAKKSIIKNDQEKYYSNLIRIYEEALEKN